MAVGLSKSEWLFCLEQKIPLSTLYDAQGRKMSECKQEMKSLGKEFAYNAQACMKHGHKIRTRSNNCIQCNTAYIAFQLRGKLDGFVYIASSKASGLCKIGSTSDSPQVRLDMLNYLSYGGAKDWIINDQCKTTKAGTVEAEAQALLQEYSVPTTYQKDGRTQRALETFRCNSREALDALKEVAPRDAVWRIRGSGAG